MILPGHIAGGYLATNVVLHLVAPGLASNLSSVETNALLILGTLSGELPDIDVVIFYVANLRSKSRKNNGASTKETHREYITHAPIFWLLVATIVSGFGLLISSDFTLLLGIIILFGTWSHLLFDSIEYGIRWMWPYTSKRFMLSSNNPSATVTARSGSVLAYIQFIKGTYFRMWTYYLEIVISLIALAIFLHWL